MHSGLVEIRHGDSSPSVDREAYVAPTAVLSGEVRVGPGSCVLHGAVISADGGPVDIGANCVIMEHAVLRGTPRHPRLRVRAARALELLLTSGGLRNTARHGRDRRT